MTFLWFLLVGLIAGWLAGELYKGSGYGVVGNIVVGIIGALVGGWLGSAFGLTPDSLLGQILMATLGAVVFLFLLGLVAGRRGIRA